MNYKGPTSLLTAQINMHDSQHTEPSGSLHPLGIMTDNKHKVSALEVSQRGRWAKHWAFKIMPERLLNRVQGVIKIAAHQY